MKRTNGQWDEWTEERRMTKKDSIEEMKKGPVEDWFEHRALRKRKTDMRTNRLKAILGKGWQWEQSNSHAHGSKWSSAVQPRYGIA